MSPKTWVKLDWSRSPKPSLMESWRSMGGMCRSDCRGAEISYSNDMSTVNRER
jgi:hypothetical protein